MKASIRSQIPSFIVMDVLRDAAEKDRKLIESGSTERVLHLEVGQPSTGAPDLVKKTAAKLLEQDRLGYTDAFGLYALRDRIARSYAENYNVVVSPTDVMITTGSSGAFVAVFTAAFDPGMRVAMATPGYPCYRNILQALGCEVVMIPVCPASDWQPTPEMLQAAIDRDGRPLHGLIVASPSNPTGTVLVPARMKAICDFCTRNQIRFISDEIYHGISMLPGDREILVSRAEMGWVGSRATSALQHKPDSIIINSFSKYYSMTGWRLGWIVCADKALHAGLEALLQNLFISAPTLSQHAALSAFDCTTELDGHVDRYRKNLEVLLEGLPQAGFQGLSPPHGAFYLYCDVKNMLARTKEPDSLALCRRILEEAAVAVTSGLDFDPDRGQQYIRFSFAGSTANMEAAVARLIKWYSNLP